MYRAMRSRGSGIEPDFTAEGKDYFDSIFYIFFIIFGAFFITNLFVGVVISTYNREKERLGNNFLLSEDQRRWIETKLLVVRVSPLRRNLRPDNCFRSFMFTISESKYFEYLIMSCIGLNAIGMTIRHVGITDETEDVLQIINRVFTGIFFLEMVIRLFAYGKNYFKDHWNIFDFSIVMGSVALFIQSIFVGQTSASSVITVVRLLRVGRLLRLFRKLK